jgi:hypothetical protein
VGSRRQRYLIEEITGDIASGHNFVATVYVEPRSMAAPHSEAGKTALFSRTATGFYRLKRG